MASSHKWLGRQHSTHSGVASGGWETKCKSQQHPQGWSNTLTTHKQTALHEASADDPRWASPKWKGVCVSPHKLWAVLPPANTGNVGRSSLGCFWKAKQLKEMSSLIQRGLLGPCGMHSLSSLLQRLHALLFHSFSWMLGKCWQGFQREVSSLTLLNPGPW